MVLLELATQGVRGFTSGGRLAFKPGYGVLVSPASIQGPSAPVLSLCGALLFSDGRGGDAALAVPGQKGKAALSILGKDQVTYRLVRELGGSGALHRFDAAAQAFKPVSQSAQEITQYLRGQAGLPTKSIFEELFGLCLAQLPSRRPRVTHASAAKPDVSAGPKLASAVAVAPAVDVAAAQSHLFELQREEALAREVEELQYQLDGMATQLFEAESQLKDGATYQDAAREAEAAFHAAPSPESLGLAEDIVERLERYPQAVTRRDEHWAKLEADRLEEEEALARRPMPDPLVRDSRFWGCVGAGAAALVGGALLSGTGRYLALFDVPAFGAAAALAYRYLDALELATRKSRKGDIFAKREVKIGEEFEAEAKPVREALKALGVDAVQDALDLLARKAELYVRAQAARDRLQAFTSSPEHRAAVARIAELKAEQERINALLLDKGSYVRDLREVEREVARTRESIELAQKSAAAPSAARPAVVDASLPAEGCEDAGPRLLALVADYWNADLPAVATAIQPRCVQYFSALSDKRYTSVEFDGEGRTQVRGGLGSTPASALGPRDADLLFLALKFALIEKSTAFGRVPVVIEDGWGAVDDAKWPLLARMLKHLGTLTQVIQVSSHPAFPPMADGTTTLGA